MATVKAKETREFNVEINEKQALVALAQELEVYHYFKSTYGQYYKIKENKIYRYEDVSYHGSSCYEEYLDCDNEIVARNYELIDELATLNGLILKH